MYSKPMCLMIFSFLFTQTAFAVDTNEEIVQREVQNSDNILGYWTADKIKNAKPLSEFAQRYFLKNESAAVNNRILNISSDDGVKPSSPVSPTNIKLFAIEKPALTSSVGTVQNTFPPRDYGTLLMRFSSSKLVPSKANTVYPYSTIGKLFFTIPNKGDYVCSASVLKNRIIMTAGHCVHSGTNGNAGFYTNFMFVPAYRDGNAPLGEWIGNYAAVHAEWANGGGIIPNEADIGMIELKDHNSGGEKKTYICLYRISGISNRIFRP